MKSAPEYKQSEVKKLLEYFETFEPDEQIELFELLRDGLICKRKEREDKLNNDVKLLNEGTLKLSASL